MFLLIFLYQYFQSDLDDFTVVGVIGSQGVGKSSILNQLAGLNDVCISPLYLRVFLFYMCYMCEYLCVCL